MCYTAHRNRYGYKKKTKRSKKNECRCIVSNDKASKRDKKSVNTVQVTGSAGRDSCTVALENTQESVNSQKAEKIHSC